MIADIGTFLTEITVVKNGVVSLTRTIPVGGQVITRAIAQGLGMEETQAEQFKIKLGIEKDKMEGQLYKASKSVLENLKEEIDRSMKYYLDQFGENIALLKITGGGSRTIGLQGFLSENLGVNMEYGFLANSRDFPSFFILNSHSRFYYSKFKILLVEVK